MSRSQLEIFGLVIIVILVAIGLLFAVVVLTRPPGEGVPQVKESIMAANFLNTIMSTSAVGCGSRTVRGLLQDCAIGGPNAAICENGLSTCEFSKEIISQMLVSTLGRWGKEYDFSIEGPQRVKNIRIRTSDCLGEVEAASRPEKVRGSVDMIVTLKICS